MPDDPRLSHLNATHLEGPGPADGALPAAPRPLFRPPVPAPEFPVEALGPLREPVEAIQLKTQAPWALCAQSVLAAVTLATQAQRDVEIPGAGRRPLVGLFATIAASGERKTATDKIALAPVFSLEEEWRDQHAAEHARFANDHAAWDAARAAAKRKGKDDRAAIRNALDRIGAEPTRPPAPMLLVADPTPEALILHLQASRSWGGVFTSEGGILVGGAAFHEESRMRTGALLNTLWDGEPIRRIRVLTGIAFLPGRRVSAHVMMQQSVADKLLGDAMLDDIGTLPRFLVVDPPSTIGKRMFRDEPPQCRLILDKYNATMGTILRIPPTTRADAPDVLDPPVMRLDADARRMWIAFYDSIERGLADNGEFHPVRAFGAKLAEHAARLAGTMELFGNPDAMDVRGETMEAAIALARHYAAEAIRLKSVAAVAPDLRLAAKLLAWWQGRGDRAVHLAQIYQRGPNAIGDAATARRIVTILEEHGWVARLPVRSEIGGGSRQDAWRLTG